MIVAVIQARMGSVRLPGKVLAPLCGRPMLAWVVNRVRQSEKVQRVVVATSDNSRDDPIAAFCKDDGIQLFRGNEADVLDRYYRAAAACSASAVVRITADCPLIDPNVVDRVVTVFERGSWDYVSNTLRYTYPEGLDTEVFSFRALETAWREAVMPAEREHVTPYLRSSPRFRVRNVEAEKALSARRRRWTVDDGADLRWVRSVYEALGCKEDFRMEDVLELLERRPDLDRPDEGSVTNEGYYRSLFAQAQAGGAPAPPLQRSLALRARAQAVIPGGSQTFSKAANQYVQGVSPVFLERGKGCRVFDVDGNEYIDYVQGLLANILGYAHDATDAAVAQQLGRGHSFSLPHPIEVELAERLVRLIPCAEMVRFGKNGSDATAGAVRAARAHTGRERVACCGYHGWQDWYIGSTSRNAGVPGAVRALTHPFAYDDIASLERVLGEHPGEFAAVVLEPAGFQEPSPGFLEGVKQLAHRHGALLIFDEICSGFHLGLGGAQKRYGVIPDLACFGKALANGFPLSCVVGRRDVMRIFEEIFFSFTFAGEVASMAAALVVLDVLEGSDALERMEAHGRRLQDGLNIFAREAGLEERLRCVGHPAWSLLRFRNADGRESLVERSLFQQEAVKRGILIMATHNMSAAHDDAAVERTLGVYAAVVKTLSGWLSEPQPEQRLEGPLVQSVFRVR